MLLSTLWFDSLHLMYSWRIDVRSLHRKPCLFVVDILPIHEIQHPPPTSNWFFVTQREKKRIVVMGWLAEQHMKVKFCLAVWGLDDRAERVFWEGRFCHLSRLVLRQDRNTWTSSNLKQRFCNLCCGRGGGSHSLTISLGILVSGQS